MAGNVQEKQLRWYNIALMSLSLSGVLATLLITMPTRGWWLFFMGVYLCTLFHTLCANCWSVRLDLQRWEGRGQYLIKHTMGPGLAYLAAWTYWVVHIPYLAQKPQAILIALGWAMKGDGSLIKEYSVVALQG